MSTISVDSVWKSYRIYKSKTHSLKETILARRADYEEFWALKDVSFDVERGEMLGVIGPNGSGKSTLLKCLARILVPNSGTLLIDGRVSALLELGTGFHFELSGRENVYLAGSMLNMSRGEVDDRFDDIVDFAGIHEFMDTPIKNYSSGMLARLAFAVAISVDPDVLLIDEVLSVGDQAFQMRCFERIHDLRRQDKTVVFVSHSAPSVRELCSRVIWMEHGAIKSMGEAATVVQEYLDTVQREEAGAHIAEPQTGDRWGTGEVRVTDVEVFGSSDTATGSAATGGPARFRIHYEADEPIAEAVFGIRLIHDSGAWVAGTNTMTQQRSFDLEAGRGFVDYSVDHLPANAGAHYLTVAISDMSHRHVYDWIDKGFEFTILSGDIGHYEGAFYLPGEWEIKRGAS